MGRATKLSVCFHLHWRETGIQITNGRTNIIKRKLKPQIGEVKERKYQVNLNDFKSPGSDELHHKPAERNCRCNLRDTIGNLQEIVETIGVPLTREGQLFPRFLK